MKIDDALILKLESLAKLSLDAVQREALGRDLEAILEMIDQLRELDVSGADPFRHFSDRMPLREDRSEAGMDRTHVMGQAPDADGTYFRVPRVVDGPDNEVKNDDHGSTNH